MEQSVTHLVTELVIAALEFGVRNPDRLAIAFCDHLPINILPQRLAESVRRRPECSHPQLLAQPRPDALYRVLQAAVAVCICLKVPAANCPSISQLDIIVGCRSPRR